MIGAGPPTERALALCRQGRFADAKALLDPLAATAPPGSDVLALLGAICLRLADTAAGTADWPTAIALYERSIAVQPQHFQAHYNMGVVLYRAGRSGDAVTSYERAIALEPRLAAAHSALGVIRSEAGEHAVALASHERAVALAPEDAELLNNFGLALDASQRRDEAVARYDAALALAPDHATAWVNRGVALHRLGRLGDALASVDRALAINADDAEAWSNRGLVLNDLLRHNDALQALVRATTLDPALANAWANLGATCNALRRPAEALAAYDRALANDPVAWQVRGERLHTAMQLCDWRDFDLEATRVFQAIEHKGAVVHPFMLLATAAPESLQRLNAERYVEAHFAAAAAGTTQPARAPRADDARTGDELAGDSRPRDARIRLGYFSADFYDHATMILMAEVFERHDRERFEVIGFSFGPRTGDAMQERAIASFDRFIEVGELGDREIAALACELGVDIAVDLKGFTQEARPGIFAARAAPVQASYLGFPGTTAMPTIDVVIADATVVPTTSESAYSEDVVRLPRCYQANASWQRPTPARVTRREVGLPDGAFVFCSFNNSYKITPDAFDLWMRVLAAAPGSVLWLLEANDGVATNLRGEAVRRGVAGERIVFAARVPRGDHLARHQLADLFLDTLHYGAHTTASDALRAGLPVLTRLGATFAGRVAASLCRDVDLAEMVTSDVAEYEALALALVDDPGRLRALRSRLLAALPQAPLFDSASFTRDLEQAFARLMTRR